MNYSTQRLTLATEHIRSLATASSESVPGCGCWFSIALVALLWSLSASSDSQVLPITLFFGVIALGLLVSHNKRAEIGARIRELGNFLAGQYGFEAPADLQSEGRRYVECLLPDSGDIH